MKKNAIVTLAIGDAYKSRWERLCGINWREYAQKHNLDLIVIDQPLDTSSRASNRSPAWQKCLVMEHELVRKYDQVAWFDCDIYFNPINAPNIFTDVPLNKVGAVNSFQDPTFYENQEALKRLWILLQTEQHKPTMGGYLTPEEIYLKYGPPVQSVSEMLNAGVLVASPLHHSDIWRHVYDNYDDRGNSSYYENVPLSYELVSRKLVHWIDPRFNHLWTWSKLLHYPFLMNGSKRTLKDKVLRKITKWSGNHYEKRVAMTCATTSLLNCFCLHFAGYASEMDLVDLDHASKGNSGNLGIY